MAEQVKTYDDWLPPPRRCDVCAAPDVQLVSINGRKSYSCPHCEASTNCHPGSDHPMGFMADLPTRLARSDGHAAFDPLWQEGYMTRDDAYGWLSSALARPKMETHFGMFDMSDSRTAEQLCTGKLSELRAHRQTGLAKAASGYQKYLQQEEKYKLHLNGILLY